MPVEDPIRSAVKSGATWYPFITLQGQPEVLSQRAEDISRAAVTGTAVRQIGQRGDLFQMIGIVDCDSASAAQTTYSALKGLQANVLDKLLDDHGTEYEHVICWEVQKLAAQSLLAAAGGLSTSKGYLLTVRFVLQLSGAT
jgi:hypothetical protein